jgi:hypothetical protein
MCLTASWVGSWIVTFHHAYHVRHYPRDAGFAFIRRALGAIAILIVSAAIVIGFVISSSIYWG